MGKANANISKENLALHTAVADPGFPVEGGMHPLGGGHGPPMQALFGENACENERIASHRGRALGTPPTRSANVQHKDRRTINLVHQSTRLCHFQQT